MSKKKNSAPKLTIAAGAPVANNQSSLPTRRGFRMRPGVDRHCSSVEH